jgi:phosphatidylglycerophosphatase A
MTKIDVNQLADFKVLLALGFGSGLSPKAPGTAGTLVALPLYYAMHTLAWPWYTAMLVLLFAMGVWLCNYTARKLGVHDHPAIVFDEIVGYLVTMIAVPFDIRLMIIGFVLFRLFDALKPWPISWCDKNLHGGFGIMFDDVLAALISAGLLYLCAGWLLS